MPLKRINVFPESIGKCPDTGLIFFPVEDSYETRTELLPRSMLILTTFISADSSTLPSLWSLYCRLAECSSIMDKRLFKMGFVGESLKLL